MLSLNFRLAKIRQNPSNYILPPPSYCNHSVAKIMLKSLRAFFHDSLQYSCCMGHHAHFLLARATIPTPGMPTWPHYPCLANMFLPSAAIPMFFPIRRLGVELSLRGAVFPECRSNERLRLFLHSLRRCDVKCPPNPCRIWYKLVPPSMSFKASDPTTTSPLKLRILKHVSVRILLHI
jgi:hypothetical protein